MQKDYITASEVGEYVYCKRAWWLRQQGLLSLPTGVLDEGTRKHDRLHSFIQHFKQYVLFALSLILLGILFLIIFLLTK